MWLAYNAAALGNADEALAQLQLVERLLGTNRATAYLPELAYAYSRIGRAEDAHGCSRSYKRARRKSRSAQARGRLRILLSATRTRRCGGSRRCAEVRNHEIDPGYLKVMNLKMNFLADPRIEEPRFAEVLGRIRGD